MKQFIEFKQRTADKLKQAEEVLKNAKFMEGILALKTPVLEAENALDDRTPLSLYDCLIPKLKEHRRFKLTKDSKFSIEDFNAQLKVREIEQNLEKNRLPLALMEIEIMDEKIKNFEN